MTDLRQYARGKQCMVRLPGCSYNTEETVLAHVRTPETGAGRKEHDLLGAWACHHCHAVVDGREPFQWTRKEILLAFYEGVIRTQRELIELKIVVC